MFVTVCPVCQGRGLVQAGFYSFGTLSRTDAEPETCRSCKGAGYIYVPDTIDMLTLPTLKGKAGEGERG